MSFYLFLAILFLLFTATALIKARQLSFAALPWFFSAWLTGELAWLHLAWQVALTLLVALGGGMESEPIAGAWACSACPGWGSSTVM